MTLDNVESILNQFKANIKKSLYEHLVLDDKTTKHNHPPVTYLVSGCKYCELHGNCFAT